MDTNFFLWSTYCVLLKQKKSGASIVILKRPGDGQIIELVTAWEDGYRGQEGIASLIVSSLKNPLIASTNHTTEYPQGLPKSGEDENSNRMDYVDSTSVSPWNKSQVCLWGKIFKNLRGLKIHQGCMKCLTQTDHSAQT